MKLTKLAKSKIIARYEQKLEEWKDSTKDELEAILKSKVSLTDKQAAYVLLNNLNKKENGKTSEQRE